MVPVALSLDPSGCLLPTQRQDGLSEVHRLYGCIPMYPLMGDMWRDQLDQAAIKQGLYFRRLARGHLCQLRGHPSARRVRGDVIRTSPNASIAILYAQRAVTAVLLVACAVRVGELVAVAGAWAVGRVVAVPCSTNTCPTRIG